jgi:polysaccharide biosynthesis protein PslH
MKILYVMPNILHPTIRGELRHYHFLKRLARHHEITLIVLNRDDVPAEVIDELRQCTRQVVRVGAPLPRRPHGNDIAGAIATLRWRVQKLLVFSRRVAEMKKYVRHRLSEGGFDLVLLSKGGIHSIAEELLAVPMVVDWCDTDSARLRGAMRHARVVEWPWRYLRYRQALRVEKRLFRKLPHVTFISRRDRNAAPAEIRHATVIPNGCDLTYWSRRGGNRRNLIVFTGVLDYPPNADAARYLLATITPLVRREIPNLEVVVAGRNPSGDVVALAHKSEGITVTGSVPDLRPYLESAAVFVAPLRFASGMQNKILEAMAMELPVVTTPIAAEGFSADGNEDPPLLIGEKPTELAAHIAAAVRDPVEARRLGAEGRRYVSRYCDWDRSAGMLDQLCRQVARPNRPDARSRHLDVGRWPPFDSTRSNDGVFHSLV